MLRIDMYFSYWILFWSILYMLGCTKLNPYIIILVAFIVSIMLLLVYIVKNINHKYVLFYFLVIIIPKVLLLIYIDKTNYAKGAVFSVFLFAAYNLWLLFNNTNLYNIYYINLIKNIQNRDYSKTVLLKYLMN